MNYGSVDDVVAYFEGILSAENDSIDLVFPSVLIGAIEAGVLACNTTTNVNKSTVTEEEFPVIEHCVVQNGSDTFRALILQEVQEHNKVESLDDEVKKTRALIKEVTSVLWNKLGDGIATDKAHVQTIFSFISKKPALDCFGVAYAAIAGCSVLGHQNVNLALSEDHSWLEFDGCTAEVTIAGKNMERYRGEEIASGRSSPPLTSWLYLGGMKEGGPVVCVGKQILAALVNNINPSLSKTTDSIILQTLQKALLELFYQKGLMDKFPMGLLSLADLEEQNPTPPGVLSESPPSKILSEGVGEARFVLPDVNSRVDRLFQEGITVARCHYKNRHVYPYTQYSYYLYRSGRLGEALKLWTTVAYEVISKYTFHSADNELYKETNEFITEILPKIFNAKAQNTQREYQHFITDAKVFAQLIRLLDGLCCWEFGAQTILMHGKLVSKVANALSQFSVETRSKVTFSQQETVTAKELRAGPEYEPERKVSKTEKSTDPQEPSIETITETETIDLDTVDEKSNEYYQELLGRHRLSRGLEPVPPALSEEDKQRLRDKYKDALWMKRPLSNLVQLSWTFSKPALHGAIMDRIPQTPTQSTGQNTSMASPCGFATTPELEASLAKVTKGLPSRSLQFESQSDSLKFSTPVSDRLADATASESESAEPDINIEHHPSTETGGGDSNKELVSLRSVKMRQVSNLLHKEKIKAGDLKLILSS